MVKLLLEIVYVTARSGKYRASQPFEIKTHTTCRRIWHPTCTSTKTRRMPQEDYSRFWISQPSAWRHKSFTSVCWCWLSLARRSISQEISNKIDPKLVKFAKAAGDAYCGQRIYWSPYFSTDEEAKLKQSVLLKLKSLSTHRFYLSTWPISKALEQ